MSQVNSVVSHGESRVSLSGLLSSFRAKEAIRLAELQAEAMAMKRKHSLLEEEFRIKLRKEEIDLETKFTKAQAREEILSKLEAESAAEHCRQTMRKLFAPACS